jgi:hypothetical protein
VCALRIELGATTGQRLTTPIGEPPGKLLLYDPDWNLFCGAAEVATEGFFDVDNVPPADFWVGYVSEGALKKEFDSYLISWIPNALVDTVTRGIEVNPEGCIAWVDDVNPRTLRR